MQMLCANSGMHATHASLLLLSIALCGATPLRAAAAKNESGFTFRLEATQLVLTHDSRPVATYVFSDPKIKRPYFTSVHAPDGTPVTRTHPPV